jgi:hypothetical protein
MTTAYDARQSTRDIDAIFVPHGIVLAGARAVADGLDLLAMKVLAARRRDADNLRLLLTILSPRLDQASVALWYGC